MRFVSKKTGKTGYAPAILGHLQGRHGVGLYPMLPDDTCWLLAVETSVIMG